MGQVLIIKTGASGDVVRTTILLNVLKEDIYWITYSYNKALFPDEHPRLKGLCGIDEIPPEWFEIKFDVLILLEEDAGIAKLAEQFSSSERIGIYWNGRGISYTDNSASWFDMSLISRHGKVKANQLKWENQNSYQHHLCNMTGHHFNDEPYVVYSPSQKGPSPSIIGLEKRAGMQWPNKQWSGYDHLSGLLTNMNLANRFFTERQHLRMYLDDIFSCSLIVAGDTLAMHLALAYSKPCIAIFTCTSPQEIHDYNILSKIISPLLAEGFYKTEILPEISGSIDVADVLHEILLKQQKAKG